MIAYMMFILWAGADGETLRKPVATFLTQVECDHVAGRLNTHPDNDFQYAAYCEEITHVSYTPKST